MRLTPHRLCVALTSLLPAIAAAQASPTELDDVTVTATRTDVALEDSLVPVQLIDRPQIERSQATSLIDLLKGRAGVDITNQGGIGKISSLFLRGSASNQLLVLVDGVRISAATNGMPTLQDLPLDQIERVEIVRGPRSSLYGADAIGGVIQIFTRRAGKQLQTNLSMTAGSHALRGATAGFSHRGEKGWVAAQGAYQETDGINACRGTAAGWGAGCYADEPDRDGYRNVSLNLRGGYAFNDTLNAQLHLLDAKAFNEYDGSVFGGNEADNRQQVYSGKLTWNPSERVQIAAQLGRSDDHAQAYFATGGQRQLASIFDTQRDSASVQGDLQLAAHQQLSVGVDWQDDAVNSTTAFDVARRDNTGVFAEYQGQFGAHSVQASIRDDNNEQFGNHATGNVGYGYRLGNGVRLSASAGTGFKAPTFNDLYYPGFSNPDLKPEESTSVNLGVAQYRDNWNWTVNAYQTRINQMIGYDSGFNLVNVAQARIRGMEATALVSVAGWDFNAQLSFTDPRDHMRSSANYDNLLARRARTSGRLDIDKRIGDLRMGITAAGYGHRFDNAANSVRLAGYGTVDLRLEYALTPAWTVQAKASNVFDRDYETVAWYNQPGREYQLSVRYRSAD